MPDRPTTPIKPPSPETQYMVLNRRRRQSRETPTEDYTPTPVYGVPLSRTRELAAETAAARLETAVDRAGLNAQVAGDAVLVRFHIDLTPEESNRLAAALELLVPAPAPK